MKILLLSPLPPPAGGIATWTVRYKQYCADNGIMLTIVNNALQGIRETQVNARRNLADEVNRTRRIIGDYFYKIRTEKPDIIHLNSSCSRFGIYRDCLCALIGKLFSIPVVVQCHCNIEDQLCGKLSALAFKLMISVCSNVLVLNRFSATYAEKYAGERVMIIPNFTDKSTLFERDSVSDVIRHVVFVGHVCAEKGVGEIFRAAESLPNIHFTLIGPIQHEIKSMRHESNVELSGAQLHEVVIEKLKQADVFLFPSYTEGFANALLEAMASGLPIITTDVGANVEMIEEKGGVIIPIRDSDAIIEAIMCLNKDPKRRYKMSNWNVDKVRNNYVQEQVMKRLVQLYKQLLM